MAKLPPTAPVAGTSLDYCTRIVLKAEHCAAAEDGRWIIYLPSLPLTKGDAETLQRLFPTLSDKAFALLDSELLLSAIIR